MRFFLVLFCSLLALSASSQTPVTDLKTLSLQERYMLMKSTSQTYQEYKVIKEIILDKEWRIMRDSLRSDRTHWAEDRAEIKRLKAELDAIQLTLKNREASMAETEHNAAHINFIGMDFNKGVFIGIVLSVIGALALVIVVIFGRLKMMHSDIKEKSGAVNAITFELEEYKRKALEKQTKLSRELQNERNRLQELRNS